MHKLGLGMSKSKYLPLTNVPNLVHLNFSIGMQSPQSPTTLYVLLNFKKKIRLHLWAGVNGHGFVQLYSEEIARLCILVINICTLELSFHRKQPLLISSNQSKGTWLWSFSYGALIAILNTNQHANVLI